MQNLIGKFSQSYIISEEPRYLPEKLKTLIEELENYNRV